MTRLLTLYGLALVFANVLVSQLGLPIPAEPLMIAAGALGAGGGGVSAMASFALAVTAAVIADSIWYTAGRVYGDRALQLLGRVPFIPRFGVHQASTSLDRWGPLALALAKFIPGLSTIAPALAGSGGIPYFRFLLFDALGAIFWAGTVIVLGMLFFAQADKVEFLRLYS
jgi:membrane protein DedA with SNARE-associated domain